MQIQWIYQYEIWDSATWISVALVSIDFEKNDQRGVSGSCQFSAAHDKAAEAIDVSKATTENSVASETAKCYHVELCLFHATTPQTAAGVCEQVEYCGD